MFSRRDDVTLANPFGPPVRGWNQVEKALELASSRLREGEPIAFERLSEHATPDLSDNRSAAAWVRRAAVVLPA